MADSGGVCRSDYRDEEGVRFSVRRGRKFSEAAHRSGFNVDCRCGQSENVVCRRPGMRWHGLGKKESTYMMRKKVLCMLLAVLLAVTALPAGRAGAEEAPLCTEYTGSNVNKQNYTTWTRKVKSYLTVCEDGTLLRFQYVDDSQSYVAEYYDASFQLLHVEQIAAELPLFGGFYASGDNYFILTGQENKEQSASVECFRITKYDKNWKRVGSAGLYDCNTTIPFRAGCARMAEAGEYLLIRTCHEMYTTEDGKNHQANVMIQLNMDTMQITDSFTKIMNTSFGYVSHSFNQFIQVEDGRIAAVDHGDAYPRSIVLIRYPQDVTYGSFTSGGCEAVNLLKIPGEIGDNYTGVSVGGFEYSDTAWIVAGNKTDFDRDDDTTWNIFVAAASKANGAVTVRQLTDYTTEDHVSTPQLVKTGANEFMLLWHLAEKVYYTRLNGDGSQNGEIYELEGSLSDCAPVVYNGKVVWYTFKDSKVTFYQIDAEDYSDTKKTTVDNTHTWELESAKPQVHTALVRCTKCGKKQTVDTPISVRVWWQEQNNTDGYNSLEYSDSFRTGDTLQFFAIPTGKENPENEEECRDFEVECSDPDAMVISAEKDDKGFYGRGVIGSLQFLKPGNHTLTIRHIYDDSLTKEFVFHVIGEPDAVSLNRKAVSLNPGKTYTLKPALTPEDAETKFTWTSSNKKVATVKNGKVTAVAAGQAKITVKTANGKKAVCTITVKKPPEGVKLSKASVTLKKGETFTLKASLTPSDSYTTYTWTSSNTKVAKVKSGKIMAVAKGTAKITVKTANGKTAVCKVVVK